MTIHKEGHKLLLWTIVIEAVLNIVLYFLLGEFGVWNQLLLLASSVVFILFLQFFRSPAINTPINPNQIIAPADGKVVVIEETREKEYLTDKRIQLSIFMSPVNVHVNRNPVSGIIKYFKYHQGQYLVAWHPKASTENERTTLVYQLENGIEIVVRQIAGAVARRIKCYVEEGEKVKQGEEFGFIKFGSRVDLFLPLGTKINVNIDDTTTAGETILAELV